MLFFPGVSPECGHDGCSDEGHENEDCAPIGLDGNDPVFADKPCLKMVRSEKIVDEACHFSKCPGEYVFGTSK